VTHLNLLADSVARVAGTVNSPELTEHIAAELTLLPDLDQDVLRARFGVAGDEPKSLAEIADGYPELTVNRVQLIESRSLVTLSKRLSSE
jgi:DNA-directed RNA polymerase sigma subunit (sigma70/sigma32)